MTVGRLLLLCALVSLVEIQVCDYMGNTGCGIPESHWDLSVLLWAL